MDELIQSDGKDIVFNTSPTGSGKTFSWFKPLAENNFTALAVYPTNALIEDQLDAARKFKEEYSEDLKIKSLTREKVSEKKEELDTKSNAKATAKIIRELKPSLSGPAILFTNPDILILIMKEMYSQRGPGQDLKGIIGGFDLLIIDEFHLAEVKQRNDLLYTSSYLLKNEATQTDKAVFLSATPDKKAVEPLKRLFDLEIVSSETSSEEFKNSRKIMPEAELEVAESKLFKSGEAIRDEDNLQEEVLNICRSGKTVLMLDSLREVDMIYWFLKKELDLKIERIDGFHRENIQEKLNNFDVLVSNSAVEVGVDFTVDNIVFSAFDSSTFMQRIGRLRNTSNSRKNKILALTKTNLVEAVERKDILSRDQFEKIVEKSLDQNRRPESFTRTYSVDEWLLNMMENRDNLTDEEYRKREMPLNIDLIKRLFTTSELTLDNNIISRRKEMLEDSKNRKIAHSLASLKTYRGENFQALVYDTSDNRVKTYNLIHLLAWGDVEFLTESEFKEAIPEKEESSFTELKEYVEGYCVYDGKISERRNVWIKPYNSNSFAAHIKNASNQMKAKPVRTDGIVFQTNQEIKGRGKLADQTKDKVMTVKSIPRKSHEIEALYDVSDFMMLHSTETGNISDAENMSTAFGLDALYLHRRTKDKSTKPEL
ncbi:MAG: type I-D CRISPR-associated helicase Cas3' [Candidatus Nanohaloarchaea archaeon]